MAELNKRQKEFEDKQKALTEAQTKLQTRRQGAERHRKGGLGEADRQIATPSCSA